MKTVYVNGNPYTFKLSLRNWEQIVSAGLISDSPAQIGEKMIELVCNPSKTLTAAWFCLRNQLPEHYRTLSVFLEEISLDEAKQIREAFLQELKDFFHILMMNYHEAALITILNDMKEVPNRLQGLLTKSQEQSE